MAARPGYAQPDPRYQSANPPMPQQYPQYPQQYQQRRRDYDAESDTSDPFGSRNTSTTHLTGNSPYYDHAGQYDHSEFHSRFILLLPPSALSPDVFPGFHPRYVFLLFQFVGLPPLLRSWFIFLLKISLASRTVLDRTYVLS